MNIRRDVRYADAETRGRLRAWKNRLARDYAVFDAGLTALQGPKFGLAEDMVKKTSAGRKRAFAEINKSFGPGVTLESACLGRNDKAAEAAKAAKAKATKALAEGDDPLAKENRKLKAQMKVMREDQKATSGTMSHKTLGLISRHLAPLCQRLRLLVWIWCENLSRSRGICT